MYREQEDGASTHGHDTLAKQARIWIWVYTYMRYNYARAPTSRLRHARHIVRVDPWICIWLRRRLHFSVITIMPRLRGSRATGTVGITIGSAMRGLLGMRILGC